MGHEKEFRLWKTFTWRGVFVFRKLHLGMSQKAAIQFYSVISSMIVLSTQRKGGSSRSINVENPTSTLEFQK